MTTLAVLSDIHGNLPALDAVLDDLSQVEVDHLVIAGDVINWGPFSRQVLERLDGLDRAIIRGNNEHYLLDYRTSRAPAAWSNRSQWQMLDWLSRQLRGRWQSAIAAWPDTLSLRFPDAPPLRVVHGSPRGDTEPIYPDAPEAIVTEMLAGVEERTLVAGHTHIPMDRHAGGWHILNPGSVGVPLQGRSEATYILLQGSEDGWEPSFRRISFDLEAVLEEFRRQRFAEECGVIGELVVDEFRSARLQVLPFLRWRSACCQDAPLDAELLERFRAIDATPYLPPVYIGNGAAHP